MSSKYLSSDEIEAILKFGVPQPADLSFAERDVLAEVSKAVLGQVALALADVVGQHVAIVSPQVRVIPPYEFLASLSEPHAAWSINFTQGLTGSMLLAWPTSVIQVVANLMRQLDNTTTSSSTSDADLGAAHDLMVGLSCALASDLSGFLGHHLEAAAPVNHVIDNEKADQSLANLGQEPLAIVASKMKGPEKIEGEMFHIMPLSLAKRLAALGGAEGTVIQENNTAQNPPLSKMSAASPEVTVHRAQFSPLVEPLQVTPGANIDLILDVPLQVSVVLGKSKKAIKDVLALGSGSIVELDRLVEDSVDILVNGTLIAKGEVVVVNENFGVRITNILSPADRIKEINR